MRPDANIPPAAAQRLPVSIVERLIPCLSFVIAAVSGAVGAMMIQRFLTALRSPQTSGLDAFYIGLARIGAVIAAILAGAAVLGGLALVVCLIRMFSNRERSSPPGIFLFLLGGYQPRALFSCGYRRLSRDSGSGRPCARGSSECFVDRIDLGHRRYRYRVCIHSHPRRILIHFLFVTIWSRKIPYSFSSC